MALAIETLILREKVSTGDLYTEMEHYFISLLRRIFTFLLSTGFANSLDAAFVQSLVLFDRSSHRHLYSNVSILRSNTLGKLISIAILRVSRSTFDIRRLRQ